MSEYWLVTIGVNHSKSLAFSYYTEPYNMGPMEVLAQSKATSPDLNHHVAFAVPITKEYYDTWMEKLS